MGWRYLLWRLFFLVGDKSSGLSIPPLRFCFPFLRSLRAGSSPPDRDLWKFKIFKLIFHSLKLYNRLNNLDQSRVGILVLTWIFFVFYVFWLNRWDYQIRQPLCLVFLYDFHDYGGLYLVLAGCHDSVQDPNWFYR